MARMAALVRAPPRPPPTTSAPRFIGPIRNLTRRSNGSSLRRAVHATEQRCDAGRACAGIGGDARPMAEWRRQTYWQALSAAADRWPEAEAVVVSSTARLGFAAFREEVRRAAANLKRLGLRRGDHIAICMGNRL